MPKELIGFLEELRDGGDSPKYMEPDTGCPEKNALQFLLNFSGYKHARRLGHNSLERWDLHCLEYKNFSVQYLGAEI